MQLAPRTKFILSIVLVAIIFIGIIIAMVVSSILGQQADQTKKDTVYIAGIENCSANIDKDVLSAIRTKAYNMVTLANTYNKVASLSNYQAVIHNGSCTTTGTTDGDSNTAAGVKNTSIIIDIPDAKQSWKLTYAWVTDGTSKDTVDLGAVTPSCVPVDQLIYGDFHCDKILNQLLYGTDVTDPILQYMPYSGAGFSLDYNPDTKQVNAQIEILAGDEGNQTLINNLKGQVAYWFTYRKLDINSYKVVYQTVVVPASTN